MVMTDCPVVVGYRMQVINKQKVNLSQKRIQQRRETGRSRPKCKARKIPLKLGQATNSHSLAGGVNFSLVIGN